MLVNLPQWISFNYYLSVSTSIYPAAKRLAGRHDSHGDSTHGGLLIYRCSLFLYFTLLTSSYRAVSLPCYYTRKFGFEIQFVHNDLNTVIVRIWNNLIISYPFDTIRNILTMIRIWIPDPSCVIYFSLIPHLTCAKPQAAAKTSRNNLAAAQSHAVLLWICHVVTSSRITI